MKLQTEAYHIGRRISINTIRKKLSYELIKREHSFLLYKIDNQSYLYIKDYGSIVVINCDKDFINEILSLVLGNEVIKEQLPYEKYDIVLSDTIDVDFGKIQLTDFNENTAHVIMLNIAQSVALMNYVNKTSDLHNKTLVYSKQLAQKGSFNLKKQQMRKFIGKTMNLKNAIAEDLYVFDTADVAWQNKNLATLDYKLKDEFDVVNRYQGIKNSLDIIKENLDLFSDILQHRYSSMLEWVVIILIFIEILQVIFE